MGIKLGNKWDCDNPECKNAEFVPREAESLVPKGWLNTEMNGGLTHVVACSNDCIGPAIAAKTAPDST